MNSHITCIQERLWRSCRGVIECEAFFHWSRLRSAGGFILEEDWTPTKTKLLQLATYRGGSLIFFQDEYFRYTAVKPADSYPLLYYKTSWISRCLRLFRDICSSNVTGHAALLKQTFRNRRTSLRKHFRDALSWDEIHRLQKLGAKAFLSVVSWSWRLVHRSVVPFPGDVRLLRNVVLGCTWAVTINSYMQKEVINFLVFLCGLW